MNTLKHIITFAMLAYCLSTQAQSYFYTVGSRNMSKTVEVEQQSDPSDTIEEGDTICRMPEDVNYSKYVSYPLERITVTSPFGNRRDPLNRKTRRMHSGVDLRAHFDKVYAMLPGVVTSTGYSKAGGFFVTLLHGNLVCTYLHLSKIRVQEGNHVSAGDVVALSGSSGLRCTGPHLHISCRWKDEIKGKYFNPVLLLSLITQKLENK